MERRSRLLEIDLVRGMAIIAVLLVHSTSEATVTMMETSLYGVYNFLNIFSRVGTTSFILLSSFVLFYSYYQKPLTLERFGRFYRNRLLYIVIPYLIFSLLYFTVKWRLGGAAWDFASMWDSFYPKVLKGQAHTHLYFVFISIQLYVLFPVLLFLMQRFRWLAASAIVVGVGLQWAFFLYNREYWQVTNRGSWSPTYFGQYFLGAWLGIYFDRIKSWLLIRKENLTAGKIVFWAALWTVWLGAGIYQVTMYYRARLHGAVYKNIVYDAFWDVYTMLTPLVLIQIAFLIGKGMEKSGGWVAWLRHLGIVSFGVYLVHPFVLMLYRHFPVEGGRPYIHHLWYAGGFLTALLISWIGVTLLARLTGWSWLLFGSVPAQLKSLRPQAGKKESAASAAGSASV